MTDSNSSQPVPIPPDVHCPGCGYLLFGSVGEKCSECGYALAGMRAAESGIPWVHRRARGRFVSFWKTAWLVTFQSRRFCEEFARDVSYRDARRFQWVVVLHVFVPVLLAVVAAYWLVPPDLAGESLNRFTVGAGLPRGTLVLEHAYAEIWPVALLLASFLLWLIAITGVASYIFHPKSIPVRRQNSGIAMSYYACAPLAVLPAVFAVAAFLTDRIADYSGIPRRFDFAFAAAALLVFIAWWRTLMKTLRRTMPLLKIRAVVLAVGLPALWFALAVLIMEGVPLVTLSILIVIESLSV